MKQQQRACAPKEALKEKRPKPFPPGGVQGLSNFLRDNLKVTVPDVRVCGHHAAPPENPRYYRLSRLIRV